MGIWEHQKHFDPKIEKLYRLTLKEGNTPCEKCHQLAHLLKIQKLYLKREDLNPSGSFKDRSLAYQLSAHLQDRKDTFAICSTGNAAISTISYCKLFKCKLSVFVSKKIPADKLLRLLETAEINNFDHSILQQDGQQSVQNNNLVITFSKRPKSDSIKFVNESKAIHLRGSNDKLATIGFKTIAYELANKAKGADAIFIPCSSGTSTVGIYQGFFDINKLPPQIHIVQTTKIHPIASQFDTEFEKTETSLASSISDRVSLRKNQVVEIVTRSGGSGWVINDDEIMTAQVLLEQKCGIHASFDSALSLAGLMRALSKNLQIQKPVLILSGK